MSGILTPDGRLVFSDPLEQAVRDAEARMAAELERAMWLPDGGAVVLTDKPQERPRAWAGLDAWLPKEAP